MNIPNWLTSYLSEPDLSTIERTVMEAEKVTRAEIVPVLTRRAEDYHLTQLMGIMVALALALFICLVGAVQYKSIPLALGTLTLGFTILSLRNQMKVYRKKLVELRAIQEFNLNKMNKTLNASGVMLFMSLEDRQVVVLADRAINEVCPPETWNGISTLVTKIMKEENNLAKALNEAIAELSCILAGACPKGDDAVDELPNQLIIKE